MSEHDTYWERYLRVVEDDRRQRREKIRYPLRPSEIRFSNQGLFVFFINGTNRLRVFPAPDETEAILVELLRSTSRYTSDITGRQAIGSDGAMKGKGELTGMRRLPEQLNDLFKNYNIGDVRVHPVANLHIAGMQWLKCQDVLRTSVRNRAAGARGRGVTLATLL